MELDCGFQTGNNWFRYRAGAIIIEDGYVLFATNSLVDYYYSIGGGVHMNEKAEDAVRREVYEETGVHYEIDRLAVINEDFFEGKDGKVKGLQCHEISFYYLMKPRGTRKLHSDSYTLGVKEEMQWIAIEDLWKYRTYPSFLREYLQMNPKEIIHIVTDEREQNSLGHDLSHLRI